MKSTGEAIGLGTTVEQAMAKAFSWKEGSLKPVTSNDSIFITSAKLDKTLLTELKKSPVQIETDKETALFLAEANIQVAEVIEIAEAEKRMLNEKYAFILDSHRTGEQDEHVSLREASLRSDT